MNNQNITVKLHDAKKVISTLNVTKTPDQPVIIQAKKNVNYELLDDATQFAPENIKIKRVGNDLHIGLEDGSSDPLDTDLIIQDYYGQDGTTTNLLIGLHENGSYYAYVPESGLQEHAVSMLADEVSAGQALGGEPLVAAAYEFNPYWLLALIPLAGLAAAGGGSSSNTGENVKDTIAPAAPVIDPIAVGNDTTPEITGTAEPNSTVTVVIKDDQGNVVVEGEVAVDPTGNWSYTPDTALPEGKNEVVATATDAAGNTSNPSTPVELVIDITPPAAPVIDPIAVGNDTTPEITGTAEPNSTVT
ncbi:Ig-like domain-containing protein, partial [Acinetobacter lwoffii]|uniref:Ig-like domain-containing protein n=1 Tax=Acinetobacter lwoffii TaxID=28090 RepID=UPI00209AD098